ncbi:MAG: hypothetical protein ABI211_04615 [Vicinamibacterales bacterium]
MPQARPDLSPLRDGLRAGRNADGGWGYYAGKASRLEPTCWALLALPDADPAVLTDWPVTDSLLRERKDGDVNFAFHALALTTLAARRVSHHAGVDALAGALEHAKGLALEPSTINRQNNQLQGWSWIPGTFSWVEPTAWALLALRRRQAAGQGVEAARLTEAETLLIDRCCAQGGWNYGNANMLGKDLRPYVPTTAVALLALQKKPYPAVTASVAYLQGAATSEASATALSLAMIALAAHGRATDEVRERLIAQVTHTVGLGQQLGMAMALHTLHADQPDAPFKL